MISYRLQTQVKSLPLNILQQLTNHKNPHIQKKAIAEIGFIVIKGKKTIQKQALNTLEKLTQHPTPEIQQTARSKLKDIRYHCNILNI